MADVMEMKVTRAEAAELMLAEMRAELTEQIDKLEAAEKLERPPLTLKTMGSVFSGINVDVNQYSDGYVFSMETERIKLEALPATLRVYLDGARAFNERIDALRARRRQLDGSKSETKALVLRAMLEGSEEGREFLEQLKTFRVKVAARLADTKQLTE